MPMFKTHGGLSGGLTNREGDIVDITRRGERKDHLRAVLVSELEGLACVDEDSCEASTVAEGSSRDGAYRIVWCVEARVEGNETRWVGWGGHDHDPYTIEMSTEAAAKGESYLLQDETEEVFSFICHKHVGATVHPKRYIIVLLG